MAFTMISFKQKDNKKQETVACSKRSDSGERCRVKKAMKSRGGLGREVRERCSLSHLSSSLAFIFSRSFLLRTAPHYLNAWNRLKKQLRRCLQGFLFVKKASVKRKLETQLKTIRNVCKSAPGSLFWASNELQWITGNTFLIFLELWQINHDIFYQANLGEYSNPWTQKKGFGSASQTNLTRG